MTVYPISGSVNADEDIFRLTGPIESAKNNALLELQQQEPSSTQHRDLGFIGGIHLVIARINLSLLNP